jgi:hypothetical protein
MLRYFPGMTPDFVENGFDGNGMPWHWWTQACEFIDEALQRGI